MAKYLVVKKVVTEETHLLLVDSEHTLEELKFVANKYGDDVFGCQAFAPQYDRCDTEDYDIQLVNEGEPLGGEFLVWDEDEVPVWDDEVPLDEWEALVDSVEEFRAGAKS